LLKNLFYITLSLFFSHTLWGTDMIIINGKLFTSDPNESTAQALAIEGNLIKAVGTTKEIEKLATPTTTVIDAKERLVLPGFNDSHLHFLSGGQSLLELDLLGYQTVKDVQKRLASVANETPADTWITGRGWDHTLFNKGQWPTKQILDKVTTRHPVFVRRVDGHIGWANSYALTLAKITKETLEPDGGEISRDKAGNATGIFKESAMGLISDIIPEYTKEQKERALAKALHEAARLGITSIQDNSGIETFQLYKEFDKKGELTVRVSEWLNFELTRSPNKLLETIAQYEPLCKTNHLEIGLLKGFVDGTLGSRTAYFFEPYQDNKTTSGMPQLSDTELNRMVKVADSLNLQIGLHCIGAKANWLALTAINNAQKKTSSSKLRHRIEHAQVLRLQDIEKFAEFNVVASMQPTHCTSDLRWAEKRIGHERCRGAYAWRRILDSGGELAFGTDWPVEPLDPMRGIFSAITRKHIESGIPKDGWFPDQNLTPEEAIHYYTMGSAYAEHKETIKGSLTPGKLADVIIVDKDILTIPASEIVTTTVDMTIFNGRVIYKKNKN